MYLTYMWQGRSEVLSGSFASCEKARETIEVSKLVNKEVVTALSLENAKQVKCDIVLLQHFINKGSDI